MGKFKNIIIFFVILLLIYILCGCEGKNQITSNIYFASNLDYKNTHELDMCYLEFEKDGTIQIVDTKRNYYSSYGTYSVNGSNVTIEYGKEKYNGVIKDDGLFIFIGSTIRLEKCDSKNISEEASNKLQE